MRPTLGLLPNMLLQLYSRLMSSSLQNFISSAAFFIAASIFSTSSYRVLINSVSSGRLGRFWYIYCKSMNLVFNSRYFWSRRLLALPNSYCSKLNSSVYSLINQSIFLRKEECRFLSLVAYSFSTSSVRRLCSFSDFSMVAWASFTWSFIPWIYPVTSLS